jgi:hypothetical protein
MKFAVKLVVAVVPWWSARALGCGPKGRDRQDRPHRPADRPVGPVWASTSSRATSSSPRSSAARATRPASSSSRRTIDNKLSPAGKPERAEGRHRPGRALRHAGQRLVGGAGADRRHQQAQRAQPRQGGAVPQLRRGGPRPDQQQVQLLALPLRCRHLHEDGSHDQLHERPAGHQEGLPAQPELLARPCRWPSTPRKCWQAQAPRRADRRRRPAPAGPGARLRALHRQDQGLRRRHRDHRQLGLRPVAAGQGRQGRRLQRQVLHLLRRRDRHAHGAGHLRRRPRVPGGLPTTTWAARWTSG